MIGVLFILAAFVMLGMTYMNGIIKGMSLYAIALLFILVSELVLRRKTEKLSGVITGLGVSSLYAATLVNFLYLHNFNSIVSMCITLVISIFAALQGRRKNWGMMIVISFLGCYCCFLPTEIRGTDVEFLIMTGILTFVNIMIFFLQGKRAERGVLFTYMIANTIFMVLLSIRAVNGTADNGLLILFTCVNLIVYGLLYYVLEQNGMTEHGGGTVLYMLMLLIQCMVSWGCMCNALLNPLWFYVMLGIFVLSKLLSRVKAFKISEILITLQAAVTAFFCFSEREWYGHIFAAVFLLSILALYHYKTFYQAVITAVAVSYLTFYLQDIPLRAVSCVGMSFLLLLLFNNVNRMRGRLQKIYNYGNLVYMVLCCIGAAFQPDYLNCIILAILGTAVVVLTFQEKYAMNFKHKYLFLVLFWTYMAFISRVSRELIFSSICMGIAIISVGLGFALKKKEVRIYGLVLSMLVCFKVMFYDFMETPILERMLLFFIVGVVILAISCIYIVLEKKLSSRGESI